MDKTLVLSQPLIIKSLSLKLNLKLCILFGIIFIIALLGLYVFQVNDVARGTYLIKQYERQLSVIAQENSGLKINFSKSNSLDNIEALAKSLDFEKAGGAKYIQILGSQVVAR